MRTWCVRAEEKEGGWRGQGGRSVLESGGARSGGGPGRRTALSRRADKTAAAGSLSLAHPNRLTTRACPHPPSKPRTRASRALHTPHIGVRRATHPPPSSVQPHQKFKKQGKEKESPKSRTRKRWPRAFRATWWSRWSRRRASPGTTPTSGTTPPRRATSRVRWRRRAHRRGGANRNNAPPLPLAREEEHKLLRRLCVRAARAREVAMHAAGARIADAMARMGPLFCSRRAATQTDSSRALNLFISRARPRQSGSRRRAWAAEMRPTATGAPGAAARAPRISPPLRKRQGARRRRRRLRDSGGGVQGAGR